MIRRCVLAVVALLALVPAGAAADDDSPWPEHGSSAAQIRAARAVVNRLERKVALMEWSAARYADWRACIRRVPVSEYGDPDRQFGFAYDEGDGTGPGFTPALAVDRTSRARRADYGDPDGGFGYLFGQPGATSFAYRPALANDRSDWDDPDYMFLAFVGGNRPGGTCRNEPGEAVD